MQLVCGFDRWLLAESVGGPEMSDANLDGLERLDQPLDWSENVDFIQLFTRDEHRLAGESTLIGTLFL